MASPCYLAYVPSSNTLYLLDTAGNAGGQFAGSMVLNGTGSIQNSQCRIDSAGSALAICFGRNAAQHQGNRDSGCRQGQSCERSVNDGRDDYCLGVDIGRQSNRVQRES